MTEPREALAALRRFLVTHMQDTHHEDDDGCYDGAESALLALEARSEGPGLDALLKAQEAVAAWGGTILVGFVRGDECPFCTGWWATAHRREAGTNYPIIVSSETGRPRGSHHDATPEAALAALRAALAAQENPALTHGAPSLDEGPPICKAKHTHCWEHRAASRRLAQEGETPT